jgi:small subunit ribosomal protein S20
MAHHKSAKKRIRQTAKRTLRNRFYKTRVKNISRAIKEAVKNNDKEKALELLKLANKEFHKFVSKGVLKKNTASRRVSRLHTLTNSLLENK